MNPLINNQSIHFNNTSYTLADRVCTNEHDITEN